MINPVSSVSPKIFPDFRAERQPNSPNSPSDTSSKVRTSIFYINDYHGKSINMERTVTASNSFDSFTPSQPTDKLKLSSGDIMLGEVENINKVAIGFQNIIGITASATGNHEYDLDSSVLKNLMNNIKYKLLASNVNIRQDYPLSKKVEKSCIEEHNGNKYGIIGLAPTDLFSRLKYGKIFEQMQVHNIDDTVKDVQVEVDKLKAQGVDKIILLSHSGYGYDIKIAKNTEGIDVILGGHTHDLVKDVKEGVNLFYSKKGEPVILTQAGRDGKNFGVLNLEFNNKGVITSVQNNVGTTREFKRNAVARHIFEQILGKPEVVGVIKSAPPPLSEDLSQPSGHADFIVDAVKSELNPEIVLISSASIRSYFEAGKIDSRSILDLSPFKNKLVEVNYTEKEIVDALKRGCTSLVNRGNKPGIWHVSGLEYSISKKGELKSLNFINKDGVKVPIDVNNPSADKSYKCITTDFFAAGNDGFTMLKKIDKADKLYDYDFTKCVTDYIKAQKTPIDIVDDNRIKIVD